MPVIDDRPYGGKTVRERLSTDGLLEAFDAALARRDEREMARLLEQVAVTPPYAAALAAAICAAGGDVAGAAFNQDDPRNALLVRYRTSPGRNPLGYPACFGALESPRDPYLNLGSHPDIVERVWKGLGAELPRAARCVVFGTPGLVAPSSGVLLAQAFGTQYIVRVPRGVTRGPEFKTVMQWTGLPPTDLAASYGPDWVFGQWHKDEPRWCMTLAGL